MAFTNANTGLWAPVWQLGVLAVILLAANLVQRKTIIKRLLLPTAVLGGLLALLLRALKLWQPDTAFLEAVTYHTIAIGFIALGLRIPRLEENPAGQKDGFKSGLLIVNTYLLQGILGLIIAGILAFTVMPGLFKAAGLLLPMAYGQGPGQANNVGSTYEQAFGFTGGASFGMGLAAMGFLWACIGGVIYLNLLMRKKKLALKANQEQEKVTVGEFQDEGEVPMSESADRLTLQLALVLGVYLVTYLVCWGLSAGLSALPGLGKNAATLTALIWGFNFVVGSILALLTRNMLGLLRKKKIMKRQYLNNYLLNRLSGMVFDVMIIAGISTIDIADISRLWLPFLLISTLGGIGTLYYLRWVCPKLYPGYPQEAFFSLYGVLTGTVSTGIMLLREVDPHYRSPAAANLVSGSSFAIVLGAPLLVLVGLAARSDGLFFLTIGILALYGTFLHWLMLKKRKSGKPKAVKKE